MGPDPPAGAGEPLYDIGMRCTPESVSPAPGSVFGLVVGEDHRMPGELDDRVMTARHRCLDVDEPVGGRKPTVRRRLEQFAQGVHSA